MSYTPTDWKTGDTITAEKLNNMEEGIESGGTLVVHVDQETGTLDQTWQTIHDAIVIGKPVCIVWHGEEEGAYEADFYWIDTASHTEDGYGIRALSNTFWMTDSPDGYPSVSNQTPFE